MSHDIPDSLNVLSLDGGGVRGLSSLLILQEIMDALPNETYTPRPCEVFDLICGTSTGGLIALMLGRLRMSVAECVEAYVEFSRDIFQKKKPLAAARKLLGSSMYGHAALEKKVKELVEKHDGRKTTMQDPLGERCCRTFVTATNLDNAAASARYFRTYKCRDREAHHDCHIWEAARATSAASTFFDPITIGNPGEIFIDGALGLHNNPSYLAICEAKTLWPGQPIGLHLSLGTGIQPSVRFSGNAFYILRGCQRLVTSCNLMHDIVSKHYAMEFVQEPEKNPYYRFSVDQGLKRIGLDEYKQAKRMTTATRTYMREPERRRDCDKVVQALRPRAAKVTARQAETAALV